VSKTAVNKPLSFEPNRDIAYATWQQYHFRHAGWNAVTSAENAPNQNDADTLYTTAFDAGACFASATDESAATPIWMLLSGADTTSLGLAPRDSGWLSTQKFTGQAKKAVQLIADEGSLRGVAFGLGDGQAGDPSGPSETLAGLLSASLPSGTYRFASDPADAFLASTAWGLGAYQFNRYKKPRETTSIPRLHIANHDIAARATNTCEAVWFARDLINTPASDMAPATLEAAARLIAAKHGATVISIVGEDLLTKNFPMIHAVGRASPRAPRLIDMTWGPANAPKITLVGKGITFDTGGLDIKPASGMLLMKKDMGGAATALALAHMIMGQKLHCRLRVLLSVAENAISGDAFRPGDVLTSRAGITVEIGNTDAEGRLVLADALNLADADEPDRIFVFATLTGAARSALGPDLPAFFTDDEELGNALPKLGESIADPMWRMPLWPGYKRHLDSDVADMNNVWDTPFAGAITAALFLRRFVTKARSFAHFDLYGWRTAPRPLGPKGGEPQTARAVFAYLQKELSS
jgi:leucyl aminopeptidase